MASSQTHSRHQPFDCLAICFLAMALIIAGAANSVCGAQLPERWHAIVDLNIGSVESADSTLFEDVKGLALDQTGRLFVADYKASVVRVYSPSGKLLATIGRLGAGPGDLSGPCCIAVVRGRLWVQELGNRRYSIFGLDDDRPRFLWSVRMPTQSAYFDQRVSFGPNSTVAHLGTYYVPTVKTGRNIRSLIDSSGTILRRDTLPEPPADSLIVATVTKTVTGGVSKSMRSQPFGPMPLRAMGPNAETVEGVSSRYAVTWFDAQRHRITTIQRPLAGPKVSSRERDSTEAELSDWAKRQGKDRSVVEFDTPKQKAPIEKLGFDQEGRLWVVRSMPDGSRRREADLYDRSGKLLVIADWPADVRLDLFAVLARTGLGLRVDSDGVQQVVRLRFIKQ